MQLLSKYELERELYWQTILEFLEAPLVAQFKCQTAARGGSTTDPNQKKRRAWIQWTRSCRLDSAVVLRRQTVLVVLVIWQHETDGRIVCIRDVE